MNITLESLWPNLTWRLEWNICYFGKILITGTNTLSDTHGCQQGNKLGICPHLKKLNKNWRKEGNILIITIQITKIF
jgi:hypothetical protein